MMETINGLVILLLILIPGVPGEWVHLTIVGKDWREKRWRWVIRIVIISVVGLLLYVWISALWDELPAPLYILPSDIALLTSDDLPTVASAYAGHAISAMAVGLTSGITIKWAAHLRNETTQYVWDDLADIYTTRRWVVVELNNGSVYAGQIEAIDKEVGQEDRDILLDEPALYDEETDLYIFQHYRYIYLPAALISSIAVYHDPDKDKDRLGKPGDHLFKGGNDHE